SSHKRTGSSVSFRTANTSVGEGAVMERSSGEVRAPCAGSQASPWPRGDLGKAPGAHVLSTVTPGAQRQIRARSNHGEREIPCFEIRVVDQRCDRRVRVRRGRHTGSYTLDDGIDRILAADLERAVTE